ncbi:hypothetical protein BGZ88_002262 [Linnemannia elongata]|nr:hypothetical protein BGZ88_002262 [Linnemannia elongata]
MQQILANSELRGETTEGHPIRQVISYNVEEDDMTNLEDQFMTLEIGTPEVWPQDPYQAYQPQEAMHIYCHGYEHYGDEHYNSIGDSIHLHDTPMTLADYTNASTSTSTGPKLGAIIS